MKTVLISAVLVAGCIGTASAQYDPYTPIVDEEAGVPQRCSIEYSGMIGKDRRGNDLAFKITGIADAKAQPASTVYFTIAGQSLGRSVEKLEITQATVEAGSIKMEGTVQKPSDSGAYSIGTMAEASLLLPLNMASGSRVTLATEDHGNVVLDLPAASAGTRQQLFSCFQRGTGFPESIRPEMPGATTMAPTGQ